MYYHVIRNNFMKSLKARQSAAKLLNSTEQGEGSETISKESRSINSEAGGILNCIVQDEDIVQPKFW